MENVWWQSLSGDVIGFTAAIWGGFLCKGTLFKFMFMGLQMAPWLKWIYLGPKAGSQWYIPVSWHGHDLLDMVVEKHLWLQWIHWMVEGGSKWNIPV